MGEIFEFWQTKSRQVTIKKKKKKKKKRGWGWGPKVRIFRLGKPKASHRMIHKHSQFSHQRTGHEQYNHIEITSQQFSLCNLFPLHFSFIIFINIYVAQQKCML